jgi:predicted nucleic acid-binding protein
LNEARYLLDTSVVSNFAPTRQPTGPELANWFEQNSERFFISVVTIAEIEQGVRKLARSGGIERAKAYGRWLDGLVSQFGDRLTPVSADVARIAGALADEAQAIGRHPGFADVLIAASARALDAMILTANLKHFEPLTTRCADPFQPGFL